MNQKITFRRFQDKNIWRIVQQLVRIRQAKGISQEELNWRIGMADTMVARWECGMRTPRLSNLVYWVEALDCEVVIQPIDKAETMAAEIPTSANDNEMDIVKKEAA